MKKILSLILLLSMLLPTNAFCLIYDNGDVKYQINDKASLDDIEVTLVKVMESKGNSFAKPESGNVFVICEFNIENHSKQDLSISSILCFDAFCDDYFVDYSFSAQLVANSKTLDGTIRKGKKLRGQIGFEVPKDWSVLEVWFKPDFWSDDNLIFYFQKAKK